MFIEGFSIAGYRSFGDQPQRIGPLSKINFFIGKNNSGKSNVLLYLARHYKQSINSARNEIGHGCPGLAFEALDHHIGGNATRHILEFGLMPQGTFHRHIQERLKDPDLCILIDKILFSKTLTRDTSLSWFQYDASQGSSCNLNRTVVDQLFDEDVLDQHKWRHVWNKLTNSTGGSIKQHWIPQVLKDLSPIQIAPPDIHFIPAIRAVGEAGSSGDDFSGKGLIERLAILQNPSHDQQALKAQFENINSLLRTVVNNSSATLEIPYDRKTILVHMDERTLPLASLGTGIHELIILASAATIVQNAVLCIEEPEIHLHAALQKRFARYLQDNTTNQYFITTHSAHFLDTPNAVVYHVRHDNGHSIIEPAINDIHKCRICDDLGYHASDLLQANSLIWVEGPSDRIYLNYWIRALDPTLVEGLHYSIMYYGGRLLSHLSADDQDLDEFISLRRLNQHAAIVIDRDRSSPDDAINSTKQRIQEEFDRGPGFAWITKGREIENYLMAEDILEAVDKIAPDLREQLQTGLYDNRLRYEDKNGKVCCVDKVKVAKHIAGKVANLDVADLRNMATKLVDFIRKSNDLKPLAPSREALK